MAALTAVEIANLVVQAMPTVISAGESIAKKLDDNDENTGFIVEAAKGIHSALEKGMKDMQTVGSEFKEQAEELGAKAKALAEKLKSHF